MKKLLLSLAAVALTAGSAMAEQVTEVLNITDFITDNSTNSYKNVTYTSETTGITYGANVSHAKDSEGGGFQFRSNNSNSGLVVTANPDNLELVSVTISWSSATSNRTLDFYSNTSAFTAATQLYNATDPITKIGSLASNSNETILENLSTGILFWGLRSNNGALYLGSEITVVYNKVDSNLKAAELSFENSNLQAILGEAAPVNTLSNPNNLAVTYTSSNENVATVAADGSLTIVAAGTTTIVATSEETAEYAAGRASYTLIVMGAANSLADFYAITNGSTTIEVLINFPAKVTYQSGINTFFEANGEYGYIYGEVPSYEVGDIIPAGWTATYAPYNGIQEMKPVTQPGVADGHEAFTPDIVTSLSDDMANRVVAIQHVQIDEATPAPTASGTALNFNVLWNGETLACRNNFKIASVPAASYDLKGVVEVFNGTLNLYVTEFVEEGMVGVEAIEAAAEGEAVYYNLQGARVANPVNGVFVKVADGKASKVIL